MCRKVGWRFTGIMATNIRRKLDHFIFRLGDKMFWSVATWAIRRQSPDPELNAVDNF